MSEEAVRGFRQDMNRLRGRLFALVETTDMTAVQQESFKSLVRALTYDCQADVESTLRRT